MKDGDKAKAKAAKTKTSGKETSSKSSAKEKGGKAVAAGSKKESSPSKTVAEKKGGSAKSSGAKAGGKSGSKVRSEPDTITFTNEDGAPHTATADDGAFDTGRLTKGQSATVTVSASGDHAYKCLVHPSMKGTVTAN